MGKQPGCPYDTYIFDVDKAEELELGNYIAGEKVHLVYNPSKRVYRKDEFLLPDGRLVCDMHIDMWQGMDCVTTALSRGAVYLGVGIIHKVFIWEPA